VASWHSVWNTDHGNISSGCPVWPCRCHNFDYWPWQPGACCTHMSIWPYLYTEYQISQAIYIIFQFFLRETMSLTWLILQFLSLSNNLIYPTLLVIQTSKMNHEVSIWISPFPCSGQVEDEAVGRLPCEDPRVRIEEALHFCYSNMRLHFFSW